MSGNVGLNRFHRQAAFPPPLDGYTTSTAMTSRVRIGPVGSARRLAHQRHLRRVTTQRFEERRDELERGNNVAQAVVAFRVVAIGTEETKGAAEDKGRGTARQLEATTTSTHARGGNRDLAAPVMLVAGSRARKPRVPRRKFGAMRIAPVSSASSDRPGYMLDLFVPMNTGAQVGRSLETSVIKDQINIC